MIAVWMYQLPGDDVFELELPAGAKLLHFDNQGGKPTLWAQVVAEMPMVRRKFRFAGTGHPLVPDDAPLHDLVHIGTAQFGEGLLVFHLFEIIEFKETA